MTRDRARKQATRATADGRYARADRMNKEAVRSILTADVQRDMIAAFREAGWPAESDSFPEGGQWSGYPGPVWSLLSRPGEAPLEADPDDADRHDLTVAPEFTFIAPRISINSGEAMVLKQSGSANPAELVKAVSASLATARRQEIGKRADDDSCAICGDNYPADHLLSPTSTETLTVCPSCVFDGDLFADADPASLAFAIDHLLDEDLSVPAGWAAVAALLACAGGENFAARLNDLGPFNIPGEHWSDPGLLWIWLPPQDRPAALAALGPGAGLAAVVAAVETAHPDLRDRFRARLAEDLDDDPEETGTVSEDHLVEELWPAVVAYAVALGTQAQERSGHRPPWHVLSDSFEPGTLSDHFEEMGSQLDADRLGVGFTLDVGVRTVAEVLGWDPEH